MLLMMDCRLLPERAAAKLAPVRCGISTLQVALASSDARTSHTIGSRKTTPNSASSRLETALLLSDRRLAGVAGGSTGGAGGPGGGGRGASAPGGDAETPAVMSGPLMLARRSPRRWRRPAP